MIVRIFGKKFKFCRLYDDDVFGILNKRPKDNHKLISLIYSEILRKDKLYKKIYMNLKSLNLKLNNFINKRLDINLYDDFILESYKTIPTLGYLQVDKFLIYFYKLVYKNITVFQEDVNFYKKSEQFFNTRFSFRVDFGKPKRRKKKMTIVNVY